MNAVLSRRSVLAGAGGVAIAAGFGRCGDGAPAEPAVVHMRSDPEGSRVGFDPVGLLIEKGQAVRWTCEANVHTATAYHPVNARHSLRIPAAAKPWDSGFLQPGDSFTVMFSVEGVYDFFCTPHEQAGMVGRIIVGRPTGPGSLPFDYFKTAVPAHDWLDVPAAARAAFPSIAEIMQRKIVPAVTTSAAAFWRGGHGLCGVRPA